MHRALTIHLVASVSRDALFLGPQGVGDHHDVGALSVIYSTSSLSTTIITIIAAAVGVHSTAGIVVGTGSHSRRTCSTGTPRRRVRSMRATSITITVSRTGEMPCCTFCAHPVSGTCQVSVIAWCLCISCSAPPIRHPGGDGGVGGGVGGDGGWWRW